MKPRFKLYWQINLVSLLFIFVSFISVTLAWFAYSGLSNVATEIDVKAWHIEIERNGQTVSNNIVISLSEIYPGMDTVTETINIKNFGDSDAQVKYSIVSARILDNPEDNYEVDDVTTSSYIEDLLSHEYPFHININLTRGYVLSQGEGCAFEVSLSWPLDSGDDALDSLWGKKAYDFQQNEEQLKLSDPEYQIRPAIQVVISIIAEQYVEEEMASDMRFSLGDEILFDVVNNEICTEVGPTCLQTYVIDVNNKIGDEVVTLLPNPNNVYLTGVYNDYDSLFASITNNWTVTSRPLVVSDILKIITTDIVNSFSVVDGISDQIIGNLNYGNRINTEINKMLSSNGHYRFINDKFSYLATNNCYWTNTEYSGNYGIAIKKSDEDVSIIYGEAKTSSCNVVPVILVNKSDL